MKERPKLKKQPVGVTTRSYLINTQGSLSDLARNEISKFATIQNVSPNSNCGIYAIMESLKKINILFDKNNKWFSKICL